MKKQICFLTFFLMLSVSASAQIDWQQVTDRYYEKYKPSKTPAWVFPIIFEEGSGQRDTLYMVYDASASGWNDTAFAEKYIRFDTSLFNPYWFGFPPDSINKVQVVSNWQFYSTISFYKGVLPLKMYWDKNLLYSAKLPFKDQSPHPRAEGRVGFDGPPMRTWGDDTSNGYCSFNFAILLTDQLNPPGPFCFASDSLIFYDQQNRNNIPISYLAFKIAGWTGNYVSISEPEKKKEIRIYPIPANQSLTIELAEPNAAIQLFDLFGRKVADGASLSSKIEMPTADLKQGMYLLIIRNENNFLKKKILIQH